MKKWWKQLIFFIFIILISSLFIYYLTFNAGIISFEKPKLIFQDNTYKINNSDNPNYQFDDNESSFENSENGEGSGIGTGASSSSDGSNSEDLNFEEENNTKTEPTQNKTLLIGSWQIYPFNEQKSNDNSLMDFYTSIIKNYDIFLLQGITNINSFSRLCSLMPDYNCISSTLSGDEAKGYGVLYKKRNLSVLSVLDHNPDTNWEHPPLEVLFKINDYSFRIYNFETDITNVEEEINNLEDNVATNGNMIITGNLNTDCELFLLPSEKFSEWYWVIGDNADTVVGAEDCAYDRIILNSEAYGEFAPYELGVGVYSHEIITDLSNHYITWIEIRPEEQS